MAIEIAVETSIELHELWLQARQMVTSMRGGPQLASAISDNVADEELIDHLITRRELWLASAGDGIVGFAIYRSNVILALFVDPHHRRQGIAKSIVTSLRSLDSPPVDALALPGDRATKSLYESFGWKARLLTMHAE